MHTEGHDPKHPALDAEHPGYEVTDVNVSGIVVFLAGLVGFLLVFFVFCFYLGRVVNGQLLKEWGPPTKWNQRSAFQGAAATNGERENLASNTEQLQRQLNEVAQQFPAPRLESDDGLSDTANLHAREDLLLDHYSTIDGNPNAVRIPIGRAMELIAQRGLPMAAAAQAGETPMTGDGSKVVLAPLTTGFARTGYEQEQIETRAQKMDFERAEASEHESAGSK